MKLDLLQSTGGRVQQMEQQMGQVRQLSDMQMFFSSTSSICTSSTSSTKLRKVSQGLSRNMDHSWAQCKTSAVVESFSQVLKSPQIPEGVSVPDFDEKLRPITAQEGDNAVFKAKVLCQLSDTMTYFYDNINIRHTQDLALVFKKMLKKCNVGKREEKWPPTEEEMLKILARDDKKDDERICTEHSFTDFTASSRS
ncbi:hypothetical protein NQZ68_026534 [Dissostichus eleginoides]|nr:hypothetical protein NQZ68_026534 [Dissostichus eleginoides]